MADQPLVPAAVHLDLDGARHIYMAHGWSYRHEGDPLFESGLRHALELFGRCGVRATLFVIAEDLRDPDKRPMIEEAARAGHEIASHSQSHARLTSLSSAVKRQEIADSRARLSNELGVQVLGFRAPGFHVDDECFDLIAEAGYTYDSSMLARGPADRERPGGDLSNRALIELPVPTHRRPALPFHPSYSLVLGDWYFRAGLEGWLERRQPLVLLFHLTDFADPLSDADLRGWRQRLYTLSHLDAGRKRARSGAMLQLVQQRCALTDTTTLLTAINAAASLRTRPS